MHHGIWYKERGIWLPALRRLNAAYAQSNAVNPDSKSDLPRVFPGGKIQVTAPGSLRYTRKVPHGVSQSGIPNREVGAGQAGIRQVGTL